MAGAAIPAADQAHLYRAECAKETIGKIALLGWGARAAIQQARNNPREWGRGAAGFGKRLGFGFTQLGIKKSIQFTVASIRQEEVGYHRSGKGGVGPRLKYALVSTVVTHKKTTGRETIAAGRISGAVGSGFVSRLWAPARLRTVSGGIASSGVSLGLDAATHVVQEFWPEIRHPRRHSADGGGEGPGETAAAPDLH